MTDQPQLPHEQQEKGTILLTVTIIVFMIAAAAAVTMKLALTDLQQNNQQRKEMQSRQIAESAVNIGVSRLNQKLLKNTDIGELGNTSDVIISDSDGDSPFGSFEVPGGGNLPANEATDRFDNDGDGVVDNEPSNEYTGAQYRIHITEWSTTNGIDDNRDGEVDDAREAAPRVSSNPVNFKISDDGDLLNPKHPFQVDISVLGAVPDTPDPDSNLAGRYHAPVTAQVIINGQVFEPWGPYDDPIAGNIHSHGNKDITWNPNTVFPEEATITFNFRSWHRTDFQWTIPNPGSAPPTEQNLTWDYETLRNEKGNEDPDTDEQVNNDNLDPARDGDPLPGYEGANNQEDPADFLAKDIISDTPDGEGKELSLSANQAIFMGELTHDAKWKENADGENVCKNCDKSGVDFQDIVVDVDITTLPGGGGSDVVTSDSQHRRRFTMDVTGTYGGLTTELGTIVNATPQPEGKYGVFGTTSLALDEGVVVDSYNSNRGTTYLQQQTDYTSEGNGVNYARTNGNVGSNDSLTLGNNAVVMGRMDHGASTPFKSPNSYVHNSSASGELDETRTFEFPTPKEPKNPPTLEGTLTVNANQSYTIPEGSNHEFTSIKLKNSAELVIEKNSFVSIENSFQAGPKATLKVEAPATIHVGQDFITSSEFEFQANTNGRPVEAYVENELSIGPESLVYSTDSWGSDPTGRTENLRWYVGTKSGTGGTVHIAPGSNKAGNDPAAFYGTIYGPEADTTIYPNTQIFGAVIGDQVNVKPNAEIHYDEALDKFCVQLWDECNYKARVDSSWIKSTRGSLSK